MGDLHVLLVGIDQYRPGRIPGIGVIPDLRGCAHDVDRMEAFLVAGPLAVSTKRIRRLVSPRLQPDRIEPQREELPTYRNLVQEIEGFMVRARPGDQVLIHYSGHGASVPTAIPEKKGPSARDECLVPCDVGAPFAEGGAVLRDIELYDLLRRLVQHGLQVTVFLDCCRSGGISQDLSESGVRGLGDLHIHPEIPHFLRESEYLETRLPPHRKTKATRAIRCLEIEPGWFPYPDGCVILSACLPTERAREYPLENGKWGGALTHVLLQILQDLAPSATYRWLHYCLLGMLSQFFDDQTPSLLGDESLTVLGGGRRQVCRGIPVLRVTNEAGQRRVLLGAGRAQGLGRRALLEVCGTDDEGEATAVGEVEELGATSAWIRLSAGEVTKPVISPGDLALLVDPGLAAMPYRVGILPLPEAAEDFQDSLDRVEESLTAGSRPLLAKGDWRVGEADVLIEILPRGVFQIADLSGVPLPYQGQQIGVGERSAVDRLLDRLEHLSRFSQVRNLDNPDPSSPLAGKLRAEVFALRAMEDWLDPKARVSSSIAPPVAPLGLLLCLLITNDSAQEVSFVVFDLQPDWGISRVHPGRNEGDFATLIPGAQHPVFLRTSLPDGIERGADHLKILAASRSLYTSHLEQGSLTESINLRPATYSYSRLHSEKSPDRSDLIGRKGSMRSGRPVSHEWVTANVELRVSRQMRLA